MKRVLYIVLCGLLYVLPGCLKEDSNEEARLSNSPVKTYNCFSVFFPEDSVKVHMDGLYPKWDENDEIGIFSDLSAPVLYKRGEDGKFRGEEISGHTFYAVYPFLLTSNYDAENPSLWHLASLSTDVRSLPMAAKSSDNDLYFRQLCGMLRFPLKGNKKLISFEIDGNGGPQFSHYSIDFSGEYPRVISDNNQIYSGTVLKPDVDLSKEDVYYQMVLLPEMEFPYGFTIDIVCQDPVTSACARFKKETRKSVTVHRAKSLTFPLIDLARLDEEIDNHEQIIAEERQALFDLYESLDGDNWFNNTNWCSDKPVGEWYGIVADSMTERVFSITLRRNNLNGILPHSIGAFQKMAYLSLCMELDDYDYRNGRSLYGEIPEEIGQLTDLWELNLTGHTFSGRFPESIRNLQELRFLDLSSALSYELEKSMGELEGEFPSSISALKNLSFFSIQGNQFSGFIPSDAFSQLSNLSELLIGSNRFSGELPDFSGLSYLRWINFANNYFTGSIPDSLSDLLDNYNGHGKFEFCFAKNCLTGIDDAVLSHPNFSETAWSILQNQRDGYKLDVDDTRIPACTHVFQTLDGGQLDLGSLYKYSDYTMIVRWSEWCSVAHSFIPEVILLAKQYEPMGLKTVWAYAGGDESGRNAYMSSVGLDILSPHIIECYNGDTYNLTTDHAVWLNGMEYGLPFVEIVDRDGNIVFISDDEGYYSQMSFSHKRDELPLFLAGLFGGVYESSDYSLDGSIHILQEASKGEGVNVILMGDAFSDRLIADGTYETVMQKAMAALFSEEPYKSFKDFFNVYYVDVVSKNEVYYGETALSTRFGEGTYVEGDNGKVLNYARKVLSDEEIDDALLVVMINRDSYAGTCHMSGIASGDYGRGYSISYFPTSSDIATFNGVLSHEAGGHGFAKLADEYSYSGTISQDEIDNNYHAMEPYGWWKNVDFTSDPSQVKWAQFLTDDRYANEGLGVFEGACTYAYGAWRPTEESIMNHNTGGFNAPSRYAIWYRIHKLAYGEDWQGTYEDFVEYDKVNRTPAAVAKRKAQRRNYVEKDFEPLAPPVIINKDWRELVK